MCSKTRLSWHLVMGLVPLPVRLVYSLTSEVLGSRRGKTTALVQALTLIAVQVDLFLGSERVQTQQ
jgi:hypothetical protein